MRCTATSTALAATGPRLSSPHNSLSAGNQADKKQARSRLHPANSALGPPAGPTSRSVAEHHPPEYSVAAVLRGRHTLGVHRRRRADQVVLARHSLLQRVWTRLLPGALGSAYAGDATVGHRHADVALVTLAGPYL